MQPVLWADAIPDGHLCTSPRCCSDRLPSFAICSARRPWCTKSSESTSTGWTCTRWGLLECWGACSCAAGDRRSHAAGSEAFGHGCHGLQPAPSSWLPAGQPSGAAPCQPSEWCCTTTQRAVLPISAAHACCPCLLPPGTRHQARVCRGGAVGTAGPLLQSQHVSHALLGSNPAYAACSAGGQCGY